ncbi:MAG: hypothetical protein WAN81_21145, partial [Candidatus Binataceae bacterium]
HGGRYYIVCPNLADDLRATDGAALPEWFNSKCKPAGVPMQLVPAPPDGSQQISARTLKEAIELAGDPLTRGEVLSELSLRLPRTFPLVGIEDGSTAMTVKIRVARDLASEEEHALDEAIASLQQPWRHETEVQGVQEKRTPERPPAQPAAPAGLPALVPSRLLFRSASSQLRSIYEEDEDFWSTNRVKVLGSWAVDPTALIPNRHWDSNTSRCVIFGHDSDALPIVNPLSVFRKVALVLAPMTTIAEVCGRLKCTESDLLQLMELGRVQLVLAHSPEQYPIRFLQLAAERSPEQMLFPRRLAALVVVDSRKRLPLLFAPFTTAERAVIIRALRQAAEAVEEPARRILDRAASSLAEIWCKTYEVVNRHGSLGASTVGLGGLMGTIFRENGPASRELEFLHAALVVQWAGALNALAFPTATISSPFVEILATLYSGAPVRAVPEFASNLETLVGGLLTVDEGVPPLELARSLGGGDIDRFRGLVEDVLRVNADAEAIRGVVERFNATVKTYETRSSRFRRLDVFALLLALGALTKQSWIPLSGWFAKRIIQQLQEYRGSNAVIGSVIDALDGMATGVHPPVVLVARMQAAVAEARTASGSRR